MIDRENLIQRATDARENAYAPYSRFKVGAAIQTEDGSVFTGVNVENASYGLTICAERNAIFAAVTAGHARIVAVAVVTDGAASPCGACRQVIREFAAPDCEAFLASPDGTYRTTTLAELLPDSFGPDALE